MFDLSSILKQLDRCECVSKNKLILNISQVLFVFEFYNRMQVNNSVNQAYQKRNLKPAFVKLQSQNLHLPQFSVNILNEINNQLKPTPEIVEASSIKPDPQPCPPKQKWKAQKITSAKQIKQKQHFYRKKQKKATLQRLSIQTKLFMLQQKKQNKNTRSMTLFQFPSQKALISKQKVVPLILKEKEQYVVQICRIFKQNCSSIQQENTKEHEAFIQSQAKKLKSCQAQKTKTPPNLAFNYDGSIMTITPATKKNKIQCIECVGAELQEEIVQPLDEYVTANKAKIPTKPSEGSNFQKLEQFQSGYTDNFERIKWNPKITVEYSSKFRASFRKSREMQPIQGVKQRLLRDRSRANTLSVSKMLHDEKSKIKVYSSQAYEEHLLTKPVQVNGKRSYLTKYPQNQINEKLSQNAERNKSSFLKSIQQAVGNTQKDESNNQANCQFLDNFLKSSASNCNEKVLHNRCKSADFRLNNPSASNLKMKSPNKVDKLKKKPFQKEAKQKVKKPQTQKRKQVRKHTRVRPSYDFSSQKWKN